MESKREKLLALLVEKSFHYDPSRPFKLRSGKMSDVYIDAKAVTLTAQGMPLVGEAVWEKIATLEAQAIGGLTLGADPIAYAAALFAALTRKGKLDVFIVRKEAKAHGTGKGIEGPVAPGKRVIVVDDVVTTGGATLTAIERVLEAGMEILKVVPLVDRQEGGREAIEALGLEYDPVFTKEELLARYRQSGKAG
ncbi:MAG: orotate phosphoribosyltransferase [Aquificota bacterium]|nr:MAG: orotate phosphoribosyltransferase [Aquificota bacterium]